jgi:four helix bundle protein
VIVADLTPFVGSGLVRQQVDAADSICGNLEEGYGRGSKKEFIHFVRIARGSAREVLGRCERFRHWLSVEAVAVTALSQTKSSPSSPAL